MTISPRKLAADLRDRLEVHVKRSVLGRPGP